MSKSSYQKDMTSMLK